MKSELTLSKSRANRRQSAKDGRHKDTTATAEEVVKGIRAPASEESGSDVRASIDQTLVPLVAFGVRVGVLSGGRCSRNTESGWKG